MYRACSSAPPLMSAPYRCTTTASFIRRRVMPPGCAGALRCESAPAQPRLLRDARWSRAACGRALIGSGRRGLFLETVRHRRRRLRRRQRQPIVRRVRVGRRASAGAPAPGAPPAAAAAPPPPRRVSCGLSPLTACGCGCGAASAVVGPGCGCLQPAPGTLFRAGARGRVCVPSIVAHAPLVEIDLRAQRLDAHRQALRLDADARDLE